MQLFVGASTFTFMHLTDKTTYIYTLYQFLHSLGIESMSLALQTHTAWATFAVAQVAVQLGKVVLSENRTGVNK